MLTPTALDPSKRVHHFALIFAISVRFMENESGFPNFLPWPLFNYNYSAAIHKVYTG